MKALITGATSGIGKCMAVQLSKLGWELILTGRNAAALDALKQTLKTNVYTVTADLSSQTDVCKVYNFCKQHSVDMVINNAGYGIFGRFDETEINNELAMLNVNIVAVHILTKLFLRDFKRRNSGLILNVASSAGFMTGPLLSSYYASKNYVVRLSLAIAEELRRDRSKVKICVFCPGPVNTEFNSRAGVEFSFKPLSAEYAAKYALDNAFKGKTLIIPTFMMKLSLFATKFLPLSLVGAVTYNIQKKKLL